MPRARPVPLWKSGTYFWCLDKRNKRIEKEFLYKEDGDENNELVKNVIIAAASRLRITLCETDLKWLRRHKGNFCFYLHPKSGRAKTIFQYKKFRKKRRKDVRIIYKAHPHHTNLKPSPRFANVEIAPQTAANYEIFLRQLWWFMAMVGDYDSMLLLLVHPPAAGTPASNVNTLKAFFEHRFLPLGTKLYVNGDVEVPLLDIHGRHIQAQGGVKNYNWLSSGYSALAHIHQTHHHNGGYHPRCDTCFTLFSEPDPSPTPCQHHHHQHYAPSGDPCSSSTLVTSDKLVFGIGTVHICV